MPRQNTIVLVYRDEIEQFAMLMNQGLPLDTLIHLTFKKDEEIITYLKEGMSLHMTGKWCACSAPSVYL